MHDAANLGFHHGTGDGIEQRGGRRPVRGLAERRRGIHGRVVTIDLVGFLSLALAPAVAVLGRPLALNSLRARSARNYMVRPQRRVGG